MLKIRLRRMGKKKQPTYRIVVAEARAPRDGAFVDVIGHYNPRTEPRTIVLDQEKAKKWLSNGAQPTETVARMLYREGLIERPAFMDRVKTSAASAASAESSPAENEASAPAEEPASETAEAASAEA